jgi:hypothetical protein
MRALESHLEVQSATHFPLLSMLLSLLFRAFYGFHFFAVSTPDIRAAWPRDPDKPTIDGSP